MRKVPASYALKSHVLEEIADEEFVACHVPEQQRLPLVERDTLLSEDNEGAIAAGGIEAAI